MKRMKEKSVTIDWECLMLSFHCFEGVLFSSLPSESLGRLLLLLPSPSHYDPLPLPPVPSEFSRAFPPVSHCVCPPSVSRTFFVSLSLSALPLVNLRAPTTSPESKEVRTRQATEEEDEAASLDDREEKRRGERDIQDKKKTRE